MMTDEGNHTGRSWRAAGALPWEGGKGKHLGTAGDGDLEVGAAGGVGGFLQQ